MPKKPIENKESAESQAHIQDLQRRAEAFVSDELSFFESEELPQALREYVLTYEEAEINTSFDLLVQGGMALPAPEKLDDMQLTAKLWEVIHGLALLRTFLYSTNHLSDRELYEELWYEELLVENPYMPDDENSVCHIDLVGSGSKEDSELYLRYYADEEDRNEWAKDWPNDIIPAHETPPYDRDRYLPTCNQYQFNV